MIINNFAYKPPSYVSNDEAKELLDGKFEFHKDIVVSKESFYGDDVWTWFDKSNERLNHYSIGQLRITWSKLKLNYNLTETIISDLKKYALLRSVYSRYIFSAFSQVNINPHPATVVNEIKVLVLFLKYLRESLTEDDFCLIDKISDIKIEDILHTLSVYQKNQTEMVRRVLMQLSSVNFVTFLEGGKLDWNEYDIKNIPWRRKPRTSYERIPEKLFCLLSNSATADIKCFLQALNIDSNDKTKIGDGNNFYLHAYPNFKTIFEENVVKNKGYRIGATIQEKSAYTVWTRKIGGLKPFSNLVGRARKAAQLIIAMYTGARLSELGSFKVGCLKEEKDGWFLVGTVCKHRNINDPIEQDKWVAIPIVRDAVKLLEETNRLVRVDNLFHGSKSTYVNKETNLGAMSDVISRRFCEYLKIIDEQNEWKTTKLHAHMFRHTLVFQMRKAGLNLPFITFQLKHKYDALNRSQNNLSLLYGGIGSNAAAQAVEAANMEFLSQVYHPDAPIAGGGAEEHKTRRAAFFQGMAVQGVGVEEVLHKLAEQGMPLVDVGLGLCQGQRKIVIDGIKTDPPCIGQLRCNPLRCSNGIIPEYKIPAWERLAKENRKRAADPEFAHTRAYHEEAASEAESVVQSFHLISIEPEKKTDKNK